MRVHNLLIAITCTFVSTTEVAHAQNGDNIAITKTGAKKKAAFPDPG
jgi:hypothetical protein